MNEYNLSFVQRLLKKFDIVVYTGNKFDDLALMEIELEDLYKWKLISNEEYVKAIMVIKLEADKEG